MSDKKSLLSYFLPPRDDLQGQFCFLSGFSASPDFVDRALENFTGMGSQQRSSKQKLHMALFLDKRKPQIASISGLYHCMYEGNNNDFSLMHAKVGILTFAKNEFNPIETVRLIVSTGNWTRSGMKDNLDLIWCLDINVNEDDLKLDVAVADVVKGLNFFEELFKYHQVLPEIESELAKIQKLFSAFSRDKLEHARFISTFDRKGGEYITLYEGIKERFGRNHIGKPYNILICGSGFFENTDGTEPLVVFEKLETDFCRTNYFTNKIQGFVAVNAGDKWKLKDLPKQKGAINWEVRKFEDRHTNENQQRKFLHAKYIFAGYLHNENYPAGRIYLGSGNLSKKGLLTPLNDSNANIEAGVVLNLQRMNEDNIDKILCLGDQEYTLDELQAAVGEDNCDHLDGGVQYAPPVRAIVKFNVEKRQGVLDWGNHPRDCYFLSDNSANKIDIAKDQVTFELPPSCELKGHLVIRCEGESAHYFIPIISEDNEFCVTPPHKIDTTSALGILSLFPEVQPPDDDIEEDELGSFRESTRITHSMEHKSSARTLSLAMELVESIARKNNMTSKELLPGWINRLEFTLLKCLLEEDKQRFKSLGINFLDTLKQQHFSPPWDHSSLSTELKEKYELTIDKIAEGWGMGSHPILKGREHV